MTTLYELWLMCETNNLDWRIFDERGRLITCHYEKIVDPSALDARTVGTFKLDGNIMMVKIYDSSSD